VRFAPGGRRVAAVALAVPIACEQSLPDRRWRGASRAADVEDLGRAVGDDPADVAVAGEPLQRRLREAPDVGGVGAHLGHQVAMTAAFEFGEIDDHADVGPRAPGGADQPVVEREVTQPTERVGAPLRPSPLITGGIVGLHQRTQRSERGLTRLGIQQSVDRDHPVQRARQVQPPALVLHLVAGAAAVTVERVGDPPHDRVQLLRMRHSCRIDQLRFQVDDCRFPLRCARIGDHRRVLPGDLTHTERGRRLWQPLQFPRQLHRGTGDARPQMALGAQRRACADEPLCLPLVGPVVGPHRPQPQELQRVDAAPQFHHIDGFLGRAQLLDGVTEAPHRIEHTFAS
jgi:hypothetical protein